MSKSARQISFWNLDFPLFFFFFLLVTQFLYNRNRPETNYYYWPIIHVSIISSNWQSWSSAAVKMISDHAAGTAHLGWLFPEYSSLNSDKTALVRGTETISFFFFLITCSWPPTSLYALILSVKSVWNGPISVLAGLWGQLFLWDLL